MKITDEQIPIIENIHQKVLEAVTRDGALEMGCWHTCNSTHCRAGWVVNLGGKAGRKLEDLTSTSYAALLIYKKSSKIKVLPSKFYKSNEDAMKDIIRCAEKEILNNKMKP